MQLLKRMMQAAKTAVVVLSLALWITWLLLTRRKQLV